MYTIKQISKYIKTNLSKECSELINYLEKNLSKEYPHKNELLKIVLLSNTDSLEEILRTINHLRSEVTRPLRGGLECEGYTACVCRANQYSNMEDVIKAVLKKRGKN